MILENILLILGFIILLVSGDLLVKAGTSIANKLKVPPIITGITIVALGTSAPELFVSVGAAFNSSPEIALGNVVGSNISNIALVLGLTAIVLPLPVQKEIVRKDYLLMFLVSVLLYFFLYTNSQLVFWEGCVLVSLLAMYMLYLIRKSKKIKVDEVEDDNKTKSWTYCSIILLLASFGLYFGAELLVDNAQKIARAFGVEERVIGVTIIALGTSLPELATSLIAAFKRELDISLGNIVGSNIFNILGVLGITSMVKKINVSDSLLTFDIPLMLLLFASTILLVLLPQKYLLQRYKGVILSISYFLYVIFVFI